MAAGRPVEKLLSETIKANFLRPALTSHYICKFTPPGIPGNSKDPNPENGKVIKFLQQGETIFPGTDYSIRSNQDLIEISCSEASLPGSSLMTNEIIDDHTGVTERHAYRRQYDDRIDFTFYVDHKYSIINFFERWISYCVGENDQSFGTLDDRNYFYRMNFPSDYQTDELYITKFEKDFNTKLEYQFIGAYPISITSMPISYDSSQLLKCTVSFTYIRYLRRVKNIEKPKEPSQKPPIGTPDISKFYGPGLPGEFANQLRQGYLQDLRVQTQNIPEFDVETKPPLF